MTDLSIYQAPGAVDYESDEPLLYNPRWETDVPGTLDEDGQMTFGAESHGHAGVLTISGLIDAMHHVRDELAEWEEQGAHEDEVPEFLRNALVRRPDWVDVRAMPMPAKNFHTETFVIPAAGGGPAGQGNTLVSARGDRLRIILTNTGANPAYFSAYDDADNINISGENGWCLLPPLSPPATSSTPTVNAIPLAATGVASYNNNSTGVNLTIAGGTVTVIAINGTTTGLTSGTFFVPAGGTVTVTYSVAPTTFTTAGIPIVTQTLPAEAGNPRELHSGGKVYVYSPLGTTVDVQEEYGYYAHEGGFLSP